MKRAWILIGLFTIGACAQSETPSLQGYGEAEFIYLSSQESGVLSDLLVKEGDVIDAGAPVFRLEPNRLSLGVDAAASNRAALGEAVRAAQADADLAHRTLNRGQDLFAQGFYPQARLDADRASHDAAVARLAQARRSLSAAGADSGLAAERLRDLETNAPIAGSIERIYRRPGEVVPAGSPVAALLAPENMRVKFFAPQDMLSRFPVGAEIRVACDGCAENLTARVIYVATEPQFTPPIIYSLDQRDKLVFLIEARPDQTGAIRPGMPVDIALPQAAS